MAELNPEAQSVLDWMEGYRKGYEYGYNAGAQDYILELVKHYTEACPFDWRGKLRFYKTGEWLKTYAHAGELDKEHRKAYGEWVERMAKGVVNG
ncbi:MAG: hypothetical protein LUE27_06850 [Clostridia bacterium]|nr:hypothetical protein [Clostridia bacterium]